MLLVLCLLGICLCVCLSLCHIVELLVEFVSDRNLLDSVQAYYMIFLYKGINFLS